MSAEQSEALRKGKRAFMMSDFNPTKMMTGSAIAGLIQSACKAF